MKKILFLFIAFVMSMALFEQQGGTADGTLSSKYYAENDPSVTFYVDENPEDPNTLQITVYGLPQVEEGQTYVISEEPVGYETEISIDPAEGYLITNHLLPEPTPEPEPTPAPAVDLSDPNKKLSPEEIAAMFASAAPAEQPAQETVVDQVPENVAAGN